MQNSPLFSKSSLNLAQFDNNFIGICKNLLTTSLTGICIAPLKCLEMSIDLQIEGIHSRKSVRNGDAHIYSAMSQPRSHNRLLYSTLLCPALLCSTLLYSTLLYSTLLYSTLLCSTRLNSTPPYSFLLYSIILD